MLIPLLCGFIGHIGSEFKAESLKKHSSKTLPNIFIKPTETNVKHQLVLRLKLWPALDTR